MTSHISIGHDNTLHRLTGPLTTATPTGQDYIAPFAGRDPPAAPSLLEGQATQTWFQPERTLFGMCGTPDRHSRSVVACVHRARGAQNVKI
jgi:hypothetical protein